MMFSRDVIGIDNVITNQNYARDRSGRSENAASSFVTANQIRRKCALISRSSSVVALRMASLQLELRHNTSHKIKNLMQSTLAWL